MPTQENVKTTILSWLDAQSVPYRFFEHPPAHTIEDCLAMPFIHEDVTICKNVFLANRQVTAFYLMLLRPATPFRTAVVSKALGVSRLSFAPESALPALLHLQPGAVSPLGLYFDRTHSITLCYEADVRRTAEIAFHPCDNTATVIFTQQVFWDQVLPMLGIVPVAIQNPV